ncbi:MAG: glycoside hydrolase family 15 protein [Sulfuricurvum sp.]|uniref:glycoside hydrolase family 15 protein n=1 Tax=Sulfuricurvum sp. TaxID=2025608 RepID=UPI00262CBDE0|nr:glycoside hydrolase family 15 protein [Sulfuricurvum sp.]MDD2782858.1 glycoside hydrolase family 15 protein [Sulfuricurvum sp.]
MNDDATYASLEKHFHTIEKIILSRQDPITGLLPASTAVNAHGDYTDAWVRDNVYSILSVWGLAVSYRKYYPEHCRSYVLSQSVVKLMRGLLMAMMRQSHHVEAFKYSLNPIDALHAKYGTHTGLPVVGNDEWGHLQLDATSLYVLMMAQMIASGLELIYTIDEVNFVQNLVHYISRTYCTPDYGIWERGNKINHGAAEINCSSVGMAKAALEAIDGFNLFGSVESQAGVIHVVSSDIARSRFTLQGLLPRESNSKETDAALLSIIGYPGYAVEDEKLVQLTREKIIKKLCGRYGCKRFLLDGHQSAIEDVSRLHYEPTELREFEHIESEWPLFFTYLLLDALMRENYGEAREWRERLAPLFVEHDGEMLLPELYIVPKELIADEKLRPGSQIRYANENVPLVWAQSLYILSDMIFDGVLQPSDIDPLRRHKRIGHKRTIHPMVAILAENASIKEKLSHSGIQSETLDELRPLRIMHASLLSEVHTLLGKNEKLGLSGRPFAVMRVIATSRIHAIEDEEVVFLPYYFNPQGFYFSYDNKLLVEHFRSTLKFLSRHWDQPGQPIVVFLVREDMFAESEKEVVVELLHHLQSGKYDSLMIQTGTMRELLQHTDKERINHLDGFNPKEIELNALKKEICSADKNLNRYHPLTAQELQDLEMLNDEALIAVVVDSVNPQLKANAVKLLWRSRGSDFTVQSEGEEVTLFKIAERLYESSAICHDWAVVRRMADLIGTYDDRIEDALLDIVIRQKRLAVGRAYNENATFSKPHESTGIIKIIAEFCGNNPAERVLTQEILLHLGHLIRSEPELFTNMITLRTWYFVQLLVGQITREYRVSMGDAYELLISLAPHDIYDRLRRILNAFTIEVNQLIDQENLQASGAVSLDTLGEISIDTHGQDVEDWGHWREQMGLIGKLTPKFYKNIWHLLQQCNGLVIGDKYSIQSRIGAELTLDSTAGEHNFALCVDTLLQSIHAPDYRQLNLEAIESLSRILHESPELRVENDLILDVLIGHAVRITWEKDHGSENYDDQRAEAWHAFYKLSPRETDKAFIEAFIYLLTPDHSNENNT